MSKIIEIKIEDIRGGLSKSIFAGQRNQVAAMRDLDIFTSPGVIRPNFGMNWFGVASIGKAYASFQGSNGTFYVWADNGSTLQKLFKSSAGDFGPTMSAVATAASAGTLTMPTRPLEYKGTIYWFYNSKISKLVISGETYTEAAFSTGYASPTNMILFKDFFYYAQGNILYRNDGTTESTAYTFPSHFNIKSISPFSTGGRDYIAVALDYKNGSGNSSIALHDGFSSLIDQSIDVGSTGVQIVRQLEQTLVCITSDNPYGNSLNADPEENYLHIKVWTGGGQMEERYALYLKNGNKAQPYIINDGATMIVGNALLFGIDGATNSVTSLDPALFGFRLPNIVTEEVVMNVNGSSTDQLDFKNIAYIQGYLYAHFTNNTVAAKNYAFGQGESYSANSRFDTIAYQFDPLFRGKIREIKFKATGITASNTIAVSEKADQATNFTAVKTFNTSGQTSCRVLPGEYPFTWANQQQLRFAPIGSSTTRSGIIVPITIIAEISDIDAS